MFEATLQVGGQLKNLTLHNSQSKNVFYLNCLNDLDAGPTAKQYYNKQTDDISCGFFVYFYIKSILENKDSNRLKKISVTLKSLVSNPTLLEDAINKNLAKKYPDARKITASGERLSWENTVL